MRQVIKIVKLEIETENKTTKETKTTKLNISIVDHVFNLEVMQKFVGTFQTMAAAKLYKEKVYGKEQIPFMILPIPLISVQDVTARGNKP